MPKILIIDDEPDICEVLSFQLEDAGFEVDFSVTTVDGINKLSSSHYDVVISDLRMSDGGGLLVLSKISEFNNQNIKVIIMSGNTEEFKDETLKKGAHCILSKPIGVDILKSKINELIS